MAEWLIAPDCKSGSPKGDTVVQIHPHGPYLNGGVVTHRIANSWSAVRLREFESPLGFQNKDEKMFSKGTRLIIGDEATLFRDTLTKLSDCASNNGYQEVFLPSIAPPSIWEDRSGPEIASEMWVFQDKGKRSTCLVPEGTAMTQKMYREKWSKSLPKPIRIFYIMKAFRYERPQAGRYREFTQFGIEVLGPNPQSFQEETMDLLQKSLDLFDINYEFNDNAVRGLSYYSRNGFEASVNTLGAQSQIAGGGVYDEGCGWAIGVDRLVLSR